MKRILFIIVCVVVFHLVSFPLTVTYVTNYKLTTDGPLLQCENTLDIFEGNSIFYSKAQLRQVIIDDSLRACNASPYDAIDIWRRERLLKHTNFAVFKGFPSKDSVEVVDKIMYYYSYKEPMPHYDWSYLDGDTVILGHLSRKATTMYRGRKWIVFYTSEIPISDGPWKLCGLPGLILYAKESKGEFSFEAKDITDLASTQSTASLMLEHARRSNINDMVRLRCLMFWDECQFDKEVMGKSSELFDAQGHQLPPSHRKACLIEIPN